MFKEILLYGFVLLNGILICFIFFLIFSIFIYKAKPKKKIPEKYIEELKILCEKALETEDVPIASLLIYNGEIIGRGYNKVNARKQLSQHAEIVAIEEAFQLFGNEFFQLDRDKLILVSTFEPCLMCKGALVENNIKNILFEKPKGIIDQLKNSFKAIRFDLLKTRFIASNLQESYFRQVESYRKHFGLNDNQKIDL